MKGYYIILFFLIFGCKDSNEKKDITKPLNTIPTEEKSQENTTAYSAKHALWEYQFDEENNDFKIKKIRPFNADTLNAKKVKSIVNKTWAKVQIKYIKTNKDTIFLAIPNSTVLTQQMGTIGAEQFLISTTFSFTELKGIQYVSYSFETGDHATPGVYERSTWNKY